MATINVTADTTWDAAVSTYSIVNGDIINVAGGVTLTVNAPNISGGPANVIPLTWNLQTYVTSNLLQGGILHLDGTTCRRLDYDGGATAAPAVGDTVTGGTSGATGEVVFVVGTVTDGHVILRSVSGGPFQDNESLTYGSGTGLANGADRVGYIEFANRGGNAFNSSPGAYIKATGAWYELGIGDGTDGQTLTHPFSEWIPFIEVETGNGTGIFEPWFNYSAMTDTGTGDLDSASTSGILGNAFINDIGSSTITFGGGAVRGNVPPSGAIIRCPNVYLSQSNSGYTGQEVGATTSAQVQIRASVDLDIFFTSGNVFTAPPERAKFQDAGFNGLVDVNSVASDKFLINRLYAVISGTGGGELTLEQLGAVTVTKAVHVTDFSNQGMQIGLCTGTTFVDIMVINGDNSGSTFEYSNIRDSSDLVFNDLYVVGGNCVFESNSGITINTLHASGSTDGRDQTRTNEILNFRELNSDIKIDGVVKIPGGAWNYGQMIHQSAGKMNNFTCDNVGSVTSPLDLESQCENFAEFRDCQNVSLRRVHVKNFRSNHGIEPNSFGYINQWLLQDVTLLKDAGTVGYPISFVDSGLTAKSVRTNYSGVYTTVSTGLQTYNNATGNYFWDGLHSATTGKVVCFPCRKTGDAVNDAYFVEVSTNPGDNFQGSNFGERQLRDTGAAVLFEWPWFIKGHTAITGWTFHGVRNSALVEYQVDFGSGFNGTWIDFDDVTNPITSLPISATGFKLRVRVTYNGSNVTLRAIEIDTSADPTSWENNLHNIADVVTVKITTNDASGPVEGVRVYVEAASGGDLPYQESVSITRSGSTATVTHTGHGLATNDKVKIRGANENEYNIIAGITVVDANTYTYTVSGTPATPATGSPTSTSVVLDGTTNVNGEISDTEFIFTNNQPISGTARKGTASPFYQPATIAGTIVSNGLDITTFLTSDE